MVWTLCFVSDLRDSSIVILSMFNGTGAGFWVGGGCRKGVQWFFQPPPLNTVTVQSVFRKKTNKKNDGHPIYYLLSSFDKQCSCEWLVQFICQTVNSSHHIGVICTGKCMS